jgi:hypothetical protein
MRDAVKSMLGLSWAVSLFGMQQVSRMMTPAAESAASTLSSIDEVSRVVQEHLSEPLAARFRSGDEWQRRVVDAVFADPRGVVQQGVQAGVDIAQKSFAAVRDTVSPPMAG